MSPDGAGMERLLTRHQLALQLGVSANTVDRMAARGELRVHRIGKAPRYRWSEVLTDTEEPSLSSACAVNRALRKVL